MKAPSALCFCLLPQSRLRLPAPPFASQEPLFIDEQGVQTVSMATHEWPALSSSESSSSSLSPLSRVSVDLGDEMAGSLVLNVLSHSECEAIIAAAEAVGYRKKKAGKNDHGALCVAATAAWTEEVGRRLAPFAAGGGEISPRLRLYRYERGERFLPHVDAAFPGSVVVGEQEGEEFFEADASRKGRYSVLVYLNSDFDGGETIFYESIRASPATPAISVAVKPAQGAVLLIPQADEGHIDDAYLNWNQHEGSQVFPGALSKRGKYVLRTDLLFEVDVDDAERLRRAYADTLRESPFPSQRFLRAARKVYSPYFGVEHCAAFLYSFVRFVKPRQLAEVGAGYTTLFLLRALRDNEEEREFLYARQNFDMLGTPWFVRETQKHQREEKPLPLLICIDKKSHQAERASLAEDVAEDLRLGSFLEARSCDAFDATFEPSSLDFFWLDFGVGDRLLEFLQDVVLPALRPGGFVALHSSLTNNATRTVLEDAIRRGEGPLRRDFGLHHISLLEPHKRFQNAITLLQKRRDHTSGEAYEEPLYSLRP